MGVVTRAAFDGQRALTRRGEHLQGVEHLGGLVQPPEAGEPSPREDDAVKRTVGDPRQPGIDVAADRNHLQPETQGQQLSNPPWGSRADPGARRQFRESQPVTSAEDIAGVLPWGNRRDEEPGSRCGRQVLERVDGEIDPRPHAAHRAER